MCSNLIHNSCLFRLESVIDIAITKLKNAAHAKAKLKTRKVDEHNWP